MGACSYMQIDQTMDTEIKNAIMHDFHKLRGAKHTNDKKLSTSADADASKMSRPHKMKKPIYEDVSNYRLLLVDGSTLYEPGQKMRDELCERIRHDYNREYTAKGMYTNLLKCELLSRFNEAPDLPYTSLKYHTILTTNLHWNYLQGRKLEDLRLKIISGNDIHCIFDIIYRDYYKNKCIVLSDKESYSNFEAVSNIGGKPFTNFGDVLSRMAREIYFDDIIFSNLRRIKSWSVGLQYLEDSRDHVFVDVNRDVLGSKLDKMIYILESR